MATLAMFFALAPRRSTMRSGAVALAAALPQTSAHRYAAARMRMQY
jgi:hypothetical protein